MQHATPHTFSTPANLQPLVRVLSVALALWLAGSGTSVAAVYRCGAVYQDKPCGDGQTQVHTTAAPSEAERTQAERRAQTEADLAKQMVNERQQREREQQANAQTLPTALSKPHPSLSEDNSLTDCKRPATAQVQWSKRKQEYCAQQATPPAPKKKRSNHD